MDFDFRAAIFGLLWLKPLRFNQITIFYYPFIKGYFANFSPLTILLTLQDCVITHMHHCACARKMVLYMCHAESICHPRISHNLT